MNKGENFGKLQKLVVTFLNFSMLCRLSHLLMMSHIEHLHRMKGHRKCVPHSPINEPMNLKADLQYFSIYKITNIAPDLSHGLK